ncbi:MAG TPA: deoxyribodipyrimidine photo-lyase [Bacteroidales bacterium]|nr:deoxyribodipyrimidine photo-lyase [Bacteroidales bacterium]
MVNIKRVKNVRQGPLIDGPVMYWMSRDQRVEDNWALAYAIEIAENSGQLVTVVFNLVDNFLGATWRQYDFMIKGLKRAEARLEELNIPFTVLYGDPGSTIPHFIKTNNVSHLIMDFDPLREKREWQNNVVSGIEIKADIVDAHNIVPCFVASDKEEYSASTFRPKAAVLLEEFMDEYPPLVKQPRKLKMQRTHWEAMTIALKVNHTIKPAEWIVPGEKGAKAVLGKFIEDKIKYYALKRNDPNADVVSGLSPWLHFGHISAQRIALEITLGVPHNENTDAFLEELIFRRELADNYCYYNTAYDKIDGFKPWALNSLNEHTTDEREFIYSADQFEAADTHDDLWNAAQMQMVISGTMHGYMRMYWAKKILEWTANPEEAIKVANYLNDKYQLDGRDPNGYTGCAWSIGGVHDRAWSERNIFGKVRYMNRAGCERKFDVSLYIKRMEEVMRGQKARL